MPSTEFQAHRGIAPNRAESCWIQGIGIDTEQSWLLALQASTGLASHRLTWHRIDTAQSQPPPAVPHCVQRSTEGHSALRQHSAPEKEMFYSSPLPRVINASRPQPGVNFADAKLTPCGRNYDRRTQS